MHILFDRNPILLKPLGRSYTLNKEAAVHYRLQNKDKKREYDLAYRLQNQDKRIDSTRLYRLENEDKLKESSILYRQQNKDKLNASSQQYHLTLLAKPEINRRYYSQNKDRRQDYSQRYHDENKDALKEPKRVYRVRNRDGKNNYSRLYRLRTRPKSIRVSLIKDSSKRIKLQRLYRLNNRDRIKALQQRYRIRRRMVERNQSWKSPELVRKYFDGLAPDLAISHHSDWYRVSRSVLADHGGASLYDKFGSLGGALQYAYPEVDWDFSMFSFRKKKSGQHWLKLKIEQLVPGIEIIEDYQHPNLSWDNSHRRVELDLWIPEHRIGLEFQGEQHYNNLIGAFGPNDTTGLYWERDLAKHSLCEARGISLIVIPYWWDGEIDSLSATLYKSRPDVFPPSASTPIPSEFPIIPKLSTSNFVSELE